MYIAKRSGDVATKEQKVVTLKQGREIPKDTSAATIKRWLERDVIEKVSQKTEAPENKSLDAPETKAETKAERKARLAREAGENKDGE